MKVIELSDHQLNFLLARLVEPSPKVVDGRVFVDGPTYEQEFTLDNPNIFTHLFFESRARLGPNLVAGDYYGQYRAIIFPSLSKLDHDPYFGTVDALGDTPEQALGRAILHSLYGYDELSQTILKSLPEGEAVSA